VLPSVDRAPVRIGLCKRVSALSFMIYARLVDTMWIVYKGPVDIQLDLVLVAMLRQ
jgi:hypothetical protein